MKKEQVIIFSVLAVVILAVISYFSYFSDKPLFAPQQEDSADIPKEQETQINQQESSTTIPRKQLYALPSAFEEQRTDIFPYGELSSSSNYLQDLYFRDNIIAYQGFEEDLYDGYIVKLKEKPSAVISVENQDSDNLDSLLDEQANKIANEQDTLINNFQLSPIDRFDKVINAITVQDLTQEQITQLESQGYKVSRNLQAEITLMDSVPLINADDVWLLDANGQLCAQTGRPCLTGQEIKIGIIDTGVDYTHQDLGGCFGQGCKVIDGYDFVNRDNDPMDDHGHGTHVAATAAGNSILKGVAPDANIVAYKVCDQYGDCFYDDIIASIERAVDPDQNGRFDDHLDVISLSIGGPGDPDDDPSIAIDNAVNIGVVAVIAAANSGPSERTIGSPGTARKSITIGAVDKQKNMADFSSRGPVVWQNQLGQSLSLIKPDVVAPGVNICAAQWDNAWSWLQCLDNEHVAISGTSMATPHVSGMAALILQRSPNYSPEQVKSIIRNTAHLLPNPEKITTQGTGLIDALDSVFFDTSVVVSLDPIEQENLEIDISGRIIGNIQNYNLAYAPNRPLSELRPKDWTIIPTLTPSTTPTIQTYQPSTILARNFNLLVIPDGEYIIRHEVVDNLGRKFYDYGYLDINKFDFIEPLNNDIINPKDDLKIKIENRFNLPIDNFIVEYSFENGPWTSQGITTNINLLEAILEENTITQSGFLEIRALITHDGIVEEFNVRDIYADTTLKEGWPVRISWPPAPRHGPNLDYWLGSMIPVIADVDGDGGNDIIIYQGGYPPKLRVFREDGSLIWEREVGVDETLGGDISVPLIDDLNNDGQIEIIVANTRGNIGNVIAPEMPLFAYTGDGSVLWETQIPRYFRPDGTLFDLNNDGIKELVIFGRYGTFNQFWEPIAKVMVLDSRDGTIISSWELDDVLGALAIPNLPQPPLIGNFDNDDDYELVVVYFNKNYWEPNWYELNQVTIRVYNMDGSQVWSAELPGAPLGSPSIGDINADGKQELIVTTFNNGVSRLGRTTHALSVFGNSGNLLFQLFPNGDILAQPSLGDISNTNSGLEILVGLSFGGGRLPGMKAINSQGNILTEFPGTFRPYYPAIIVGGEGTEKNIITTNYEEIPPVPARRIYAWDERGQAINGFPKYAASSTLPVVIQNLDGSGTSEIISSSIFESYIDDVSGILRSRHRSSIYVYDGFFTNENIYEWPVVSHDNQRTGCYDC